MRKWEEEFYGEPQQHNVTPGMIIRYDEKKSDNNSKQESSNMDRSISQLANTSPNNSATTTKQQPANTSNTSSSGSTKTSSSPTSLDISDSYLAEIDGECLQLFGSGSLDSIDKTWGNQVCGTVTTVTVQYINFDELSAYFTKLRAKFQNITNLILKQVGLENLQQLNSLGQFKKLECLTIEACSSNPVTQFTLWKPYILFRLSHLSLKKLNGEEVSSVHLIKAEKIFGSLSFAATSNLSQFRLVSLLEQAKQLTGAKETSKKKQNEEVVDLAERNVAEYVGRLSLQYTSPKAHNSKLEERRLRKAVARETLEKLKTETVAIATKKSLLLKQWPLIFIEMVKDAVVDMSDLNEYIRTEGLKFEKES